MVKNPEARGSYSEEYDGEALQELIDMAKLYVAKENGFKGKGSGVPDGTFSDFSCGVWEMLTETVRYGMWLEKKKEERESRKRRIDFMKRKLAEELENEDSSEENWRKPILE